MYFFALPPFSQTTYGGQGHMSKQWLPAVGTTSSNFLTASQVQSFQALPMVTTMSIA